MLVLSRKPGETLVITHQGVEIAVTVVGLRKGAVRLGIGAPPEVQILRQELTVNPTGRAAEAAPPAEPGTPLA